MFFYIIFRYLLNILNEYSQKFILYFILFSHLSTFNLNDYLSIPVII